MMNEHLFDTIKGVTVLNLDETSVPIDSLWENRRIVLAFLRHYG